MLPSRQTIELIMNNCWELSKFDYKWTSFTVIICDRNYCKIKFNVIFILKEKTYCLGDMLLLKVWINLILSIGSSGSDIWTDLVTLHLQGHSWSRKIWNNYHTVLQTSTCELMSKDIRYQFTFNGLMGLRIMMSSTDGQN